MKRVFYFFLLFVAITITQAQTKITLSGRITDNKGEPLVGANVIVRELTKGTVTDPNGSFALGIPKGYYTIQVSYLGYIPQELYMRIDADKILNFKLKESTEFIESVEVRAEAPNQNIRKIEMSTNKLEMREIQKLPVVFGEGDVIKTLQLLPGVISAGEGSGGFHVRGGNVDQNLILIDQAQVYNASHSIGFFSVFNSNVIDDLKLYKGGIPSEYGGRLSSVLDIKTVEPDMQNYHGEGSLGIISSKAMLQGPIVSNKVSLFVAARRTYADLFLPFAKDSLAKESSIYFYDLNAKLKIVANDRNRINISAYYGRDVLEMGNLIGQKYGNQAYTAHWNHFFGKRLYMNNYLTISKYDYEMKFTQNEDWVSIRTNIFDYSGKSVFNWKYRDGSELKFGAEAIKHEFNPGHLLGYQASIDFDYKLSKSYSWEYGVFLENQQELTPKLSVNYGLRYSLFHNIGEGEIYSFDKSNPDDYIPNDTIFYGAGEVFNIFPKGFEPRISMRYILNESSSIKASYNRMYQYIQLASNSTSSIPLNYWFAASPNIKPQSTDQIAAGYFRNFLDNTFEVSVEGFYKDIKNTIDFRDHANLLLNKFFEGEIRSGRAWAYGGELLIRKKRGAVTGWVSYTYSRVFKQIDEINQGLSYPASYDKPHDVAVVVSYDINKRLNLSGTWVYTSAPPRTMAVRKWEYGGMVGPSYGPRNSVRVFPYHRLDLAATYRLNKVERNWEHSLNFSVYNAYAHHNYIMLTFKEDPENEGKSLQEHTCIHLSLHSVTPLNFKP